ncbi:MAG: efflux RND transporter periplasmic adaptor subunit [Planctomycetes bacterium]|nr:efflux RND transporter periplasmic adaptor subunit [Planctomycetota bacterium]
MFAEATGTKGRVRFGVLVLALACLGVGYFAGRHFGGHAQHSAAPGAEASATLWTCSMHPQVIQEGPGLCPICHMALTPLGDKSGDGALAVEPAVIQTMGVRTARVVYSSVGRAIRAYGSLMERETDHKDINLRVAGWIEEWNIYDGSWVAEGDPLFTLSSPELVVAIDELRAARKQRDADPRGIGAVLYEAAARKIVLLGFSAHEVAQFAELDATPAVVTVKSPFDGHVTELDGVSGAAVKPGDRVLRLADNRTLWLDLRVNERDIGRVQSGALVRARADAYPGETFEGRVMFVHPHVDMDSQTALVRAEIANEDRRLREGQAVNAEIDAAESEDALVIPRAAVIDTGERAIAFVALSGGRFEPREIQLGAAGEGGIVAVRAGLSLGEEVVASGQFLLDSESRLRESIMKFLNSKSDVTSAKPSARPAWAEAIDPVVEHYLTLADVLGAPQTSTQPIDARAFVEAARELARQSQSDPRAVAVKDAALPLLEADLPTQRELFKKTSDVLIDLVSRVAPTPRAGGPKLYVLMCPMAPGRWLQRDEEIRNPYYATTMKECGDVVGPLAVEGAGER